MDVLSFALCPSRNLPPHLAFSVVPSGVLSVVPLVGLSVVPTGGVSVYPQGVVGSTPWGALGTTLWGCGGNTDRHKVVGCSSLARLVSRHFAKCLEIQVLPDSLSADGRDRFDPLTRVCLSIDALSSIHRRAPFHPLTDAARTIDKLAAIH